MILYESISVFYLKLEVIPLCFPLPHHAQSGGQAASLTAGDDLEIDFVWLNKTFQN